MCFVAGRHVFGKISVGAYINLYTALLLKIDFVPQRLFLISLTWYLGFLLRASRFPVVLNAKISLAN